VIRTLPEVANELDTLWLVVAAVLVMFMQAGFACVEIGFSRGKNAGTVVAKILVNFSVASLVWWMCGFGLAFGGGLALVGDSGFFLSVGHTISDGSPIAGPFDSADAGFVLFQLVFCAVSLAIVWGTTLERVRFIAYPSCGSAGSASTPARRSGRPAPPSPRSLWSRTSPPPRASSARRSRSWRSAAASTSAWSATGRWWRSSRPAASSSCGPLP
jgi:hypothetical protein